MDRGSPRTYVREGVRESEMINVRVLVNDWFIQSTVDEKFTAQLNSATGSKNITCAPINQKTATNPNPDNPRKKPQFSVVITQVEHDIDENDISQTLASLELPFVRLWRIKSRQTNKFTKLIRVITEDTVTVDFLLNNGINLFGNHHQCEPSKPPEPTPLQCTKCYQLGHPATACTNKPACPKCPETHAPNNCKAATPKCLLCGGAHAAWSRKCPKFKDTPITDETPIAPTYIINPPAEFADPEVLVDESAEFKINTKQTVVFVTKILYDLFPLQRPKIHELVELASRQILRTKTRISHTGQRIYFTFDTPPSTAAAPGGGPNPTPHPPSNNINIATVNVDGIKTKFNALKAFIASDQIKIFSITETHTQNPIHVPNFSSYSRPSRFNNFYRGVALLIDSNINSIKHDLPPHLSDLEAVAADAQLNNKTITIISYYNPPLEPISPELFQYASSLRYCIILGDFNARHTDFGDRSTNANGRKFSEFISDLPIYRLENRSATFISHGNVDAQSIVDHMAPPSHPTTNPLSRNSSLRAHLPPPPEFIQIYKYKNADWDKYRREITRTLTRTTPANTSDEIDEQINTFTNTIHSARDTVFKPTTIPKNRTPLPARIVKLIKEKRKVYREFIQSRDPLLKTLFNKLNAQIRRDINTYREETWIKTCESLDYRDGKKFWNKFKVITGQKRKTNHYLATDAHIYYTPQERANCFAELLDGIHQVPNDPNFNATFFDQIANNVHAFKNIPLIDPLPHPLHDEHLTDNITTDEPRDPTKLDPFFSKTYPTPPSKL
ncbi:hypothetical protein GEV33_006870 [Tenebrio molitor]|uniref:Endonuclease/exonuclease/phosphatase domain-containing protein n=1 Tax=Tenebrio molitor TaxID=7067 RepID=A0A8J6HKZ8_TENMO|nr:hypothetical protein GEV33_006870 [Tenebrio molitor]